MIKDVLRAMWKLESTLSEGIMQDIHMRMQMFLQDQVRDMIRHAIKKKKAKAKSYVSCLGCAGLFKAVVRAVLGCLRRLLGLCWAV
jgi:Asp/Glu/hydantoin racemase